VSVVEYESGPEEVELDSPFGKLWVKVLGWGVYVDANSNGRSISINGVDYSFVLRLQYGDGDRLELEKQKGDPYGFHAVYGVRVNWVGKGISYNNSGISNSAREKAKKVLIPLVQEWLDKNPALVSQARFAAASNEYRSAVEEYDKLAASLAAADDLRIAAWARRSAARDEMRDIEQSAAWREQGVPA
jgi:hypothetical protein